MGVGVGRCVYISNHPVLCNYSGMQDHHIPCVITHSLWQYILSQIADRMSENR